MFLLTSTCFQSGLLFIFVYQSHLPVEEKPPVLNPLACCHSYPAFATLLISSGHKQCLYTVSSFGPTICGVLPVIPAFVLEIIFSVYYLRLIKAC
jgi:hypothetical protein